MKTFALITEGTTDQAVIENILYGFLGDHDLYVNPLLPLRDETDKQRIENFSNWGLVFEYCKSKKLRKAFQFNDYVIIQIDTDVSEEPNYDIPKFESGNEISADKLVNRVREKIINLIGDEVYLKFKERILFAVCVHSLECWLLPIFYQDAKAAKTKGCLAALNRALQKKKGRRISPGSKNVKLYESVSSVFRKKKGLKRLAQKNPSLRIFVQELTARTLDAEQ